MLFRSRKHQISDSAFLFCILHVVCKCVVQNCLFVFLLASYAVALSMYTVCLCTSLQHFYASISCIILQNYTCLLLLVALQILGGVTSARLICFSPMRLRFCCIWGLEQSSSRVQFSFRTSSLFFAASVVFFEHSFLSWKTTACTNLREIVSFFLTSLFVFCLIFACTHLYYTARLFPSIRPNDRLWSPWPPLPTSFVFSMCANVVKYALLIQLRLFLSCFCSSPWPLTLLHPFKSTWTHTHPLVSLFDQSPKTWCPGKFTRP